MCVCIYLFHKVNLTIKPIQYKVSNVHNPLHKSYIKYANLYNVDMIPVAV